MINFNYGVPLIVEIIGLVFALITIVIIGEILIRTKDSLHKNYFWFLSGIIFYLALKIIKILIILFDRVPQIINDLLPVVSTLVFLLFTIGFYKTFKLFKKVSNGKIRLKNK